MGSDSFDTYANDSMGIFIPSQPIDSGEVEHVPQDYGFIIPISPNCPCKVENKLSITEGRKVFTFNPEQFHATVDASSIHKFLAIFLETCFLQDLSESIYGDREVNLGNYSFPYNAHLRELLLNFIEESRQKQGGYDFLTQSIAIQVGVYLLRRSKYDCPVLKEEKHYSNKKGIDRSIEFIHENYRRNFSLAQVAQTAHLSPYHFSRVFKAQVGKSPFEYLLDLKIEKAKEYLRYGDKSVTEICFTCGFNDVSYFTRVFTKKVGVNPSTFRCSYQSK